MRDTPRRRVLIIDGDVDSAESLADVLRLSGHAVQVAYTAPEGIERTRAFLPDVVLCELDLPDGHCGCSIARTLTTEAPVTSARLVLMTSTSGGSRLESALKSGFDEFVLKPADLEGLIRTVGGEQLSACRRAVLDRHHFVVPLRRRRTSTAGARAASAGTSSCC